MESNENKNDFFTPSEDSRRKTLEWLTKAGIPGSSIWLRKARGLIEFPVTVGQVQKLFGTAQEVLQHRDTGEKRLDSSVHFVPADLKDDVESIWSRLPSRPRHTVQLGRRQLYRSKALKARRLDECGLSWTPTCIRGETSDNLPAVLSASDHSIELYNISIGTTAAPNNSLGIYGSGDAYQAADLPNFFSSLANFIPNNTHPSVDIINGAPAVPGESNGGEQILDLLMAYPIAYPQNVHIFQTPGARYDTGLGNDFLDAIDASYCTYDGGDDPDLDPRYSQFQGFQGPAMCGTYNITNVLSISFATDESHLGAHYVQRQCHEWMKLALQGVTVVVASGDRGVQGNMGCSASDTSKGGAFNPLFPGVCPYVTTVGATQVNFTQTGHQEVAVYDSKHSFYSGGEARLLHLRSGD